MKTPPKRVISKRLGELLLERRIIKDNELQKALQIQKKKAALLGSILVLSGYATEEEVAQVLTAQFGFPYLPLANYDIDAYIVRLIPRSVASRHCLIAVDKIDDSLSVAISNPLNILTIREKVEPLTNCKVRVFISTQSQVERCIKQYYGPVSKG